MLEVRNLSFAYRRTPVLRDVSFVASPGEVVAVVGGNGVGKTTLMRLLATVMVPDGGAILSDGVDAFGYPLRYRRQLGYLAEDPQPYEDMTVKEYLAYRALLKGEPAKRVRRRVSEASDMCRIDGLMRSTIRNLSRGQKKRVALADALLLRPRVLLLDDFLAGLDHEMRDVAGAVLSEAAAFSSVIVTGHELEDLARWTTRFVVLKGGVISTVIPSAGVEPADLVARVRGALTGGES